MLCYSRISILSDSPIAMQCPFRKQVHAGRSDKSIQFSIPRAIIRKMPLWYSLISLQFGNLSLDKGPPSVGVFISEYALSVDRNQGNLCGVDIRILPVSFCTSKEIHASVANLICGAGLGRDERAVVGVKQQSAYSGIF